MKKIITILIFTGSLNSWGELSKNAFSCAFEDSKEKLYFLTTSKTIFLDLPLQKFVLYSAVKVAGSLSDLTDRHKGGVALFRVRHDINHFDETDSWTYEDPILKTRLSIAHVVHMNEEQSGFRGTLFFASGETRKLKCAFEEEN